MKNLLKFFIFLSIVVFTSNCTKDFDEININPKALTLAKLDQSSYGLVFRGAIYNSSYMCGGNGFEVLQNLFTDLWANYFATTFIDVTSDSYELIGSWLNEAFGAFYSGAASQIKYAEDFAKQKGLPVEEAMMKIWKIYTYLRYTDLWGPIPYSEYGNMKKDVAYDSQEEIYHSFFTELDEAIPVLKANAGATSATLSNYDPLYAGDVDKWAKFGSSLRLRLALRVKYIDASFAKKEAEQAVTEGVITDNADNGWVKTTVDWYNGYNLITAWKGFRMSADMESILKGYLDPRVYAYFQPANTPDPTDDPDGIVYDFEGLRNGQTVADRVAYRFDFLCSDMAKKWVMAGVKGPDWPTLRAFESYFLRAEGALEGWDMGGTAADFYKAGIEASLAENGYTDLKNLAGNEYATSTLVPVSPGGSLAPVSTVPVAFLTGGTKEEKLEQIITQKWIGLYPDSHEAYTERRRTKYPTLYTRLESMNPDIPATSLPTRVTYVISEYTNNKTEVEAAIVKLGGPDNGTTKLWWDKK